MICRSTNIRHLAALFHTQSWHSLAFAQGVHLANHRHLHQTGHATCTPASARHLIGHDRIADVQLLPKWLAMTMEMLRLALLYLHLIACCVALGLILKSDLSMVGHLLRGSRDQLYQTTGMQEIKSAVGAALLVLWISGSTLIWLDVTNKSLVVFDNPKLQAKLIVVVSLSVNGWLLHWLVLPAWERAGSLWRLSRPHYLLAIATAAVSAVSWLYAALLGSGHGLSWKYSLAELLLAYPLLIGATGIALLWLLRRPGPNHAPAARVDPATNLHSQPTARS